MARRSDCAKGANGQRQLSKGGMIKAPRGPAADKAPLTPPLPPSALHLHGNQACSIWTCQIHLLWDFLFSYFSRHPRRRPGIPPEMLFSTYVNSILIPRPVPLCFFVFVERGVFFFLYHYPGNLIHTEHNGEERERLDRGLEEIMKFVHIQAS